MSLSNAQLKLICKNTNSLIPLQSKNINFQHYNGMMSKITCTIENNCFKFSVLFFIYLDKMEQIVYILM